jgi:hypothetical protein
LQSFFSAAKMRCNLQSLFLAAKMRCLFFSCKDTLPLAVSFSAAKICYNL